MQRVWVASLVGWGAKIPHMLNCFRCIQLFATPWAVAPMDSVHGISQARILEWIAISSSRGSPRPSDQTCVSCIGRWILYTEPAGEVKVAQSCPTLCDPMDGSLPGSSVHGILQTRILEWVAVPFSRESSQPRDRTQLPGKPILIKKVASLLI